MTSKNPSPRRHCMVVYATYPWAETRVQREAEMLVKHGHEVDVICLHQPDELTTDNYRGVQIFREKFRFPFQVGGELGTKFLNYIYFFITAMFRLSRLHRQQPYTTVQVHNLPDFLVFCALYPKLTKTPIILDLHDLMPEFYVGRFGQNNKTWLIKLIRWQERLACRFADHVITVSEHWRKTLISRGVPPSKCSVVMNVADENIFHPMNNGQDQPTDDTEFRLIYHGTVVYRYGLDLVIKAVDLLKNDIPELRVTILGKGNYVETLIQMAQDLQLNNYVTIHNEIRPAVELPEIIQGANLGVVPYRNDVFTDGLLPTKLMEYAALGLPSIAARTTAIESYFSDTMVEFFEPGDANQLAECIRLLYHSPDRVSQLTQGAEKFNQQYSWTRVGAAYVKLVESVNT